MNNNDERDSICGVLIPPQYLVDQFAEGGPTSPVPQAGDLAIRLVRYGKRDDDVPSMPSWVEWLAEQGMRMNNNDERDYAEETANRTLLAEGDDDDTAPPAKDDPREGEPAEAEPLESGDADGDDRDDDDDAVK